MKSLIFYSNPLNKILIFVFKQFIRVEYGMNKYKFYWTGKLFSWRDFQQGNDMVLTQCTNFCTFAQKSHSNDSGTRDENQCNLQIEKYSVIFLSNFINLS